MSLPEAVQALGQTQHLHSVLDVRDVRPPEVLKGATRDDWYNWAFRARPYIALLRLFSVGQLRRRVVSL